MEIEKKYTILVENFEENYSFKEKREENSVFRALKLNYRIKGGNCYEVEIQNKIKNRPKNLYKFIILRFLKQFSHLNIPLKINFFSQKITFASWKEEKKYDFSFFTVLEFNFKEKISFYFSFPSILDFKKIKIYLNLIFKENLKEVNEIPKNLPVIFGEGSGGVLFHEILSHPLEADLFKNSFYKNKIGEKISKDFLTVYDDPTSPGFPVMRKFDDEGEVCIKKPLVEKGILKNILCNNYYSRTFLFPPGNARMCLESPIPLPRSTNTIVQEIKGNSKSLLDVYPNYIYIPLIKKASFCPPDKIFLMAGPVFYFINRKLYGKIKNLRINGTVREFLEGLDILGGKLKRCLTFGTCLKDNGKLITGAASPDISFLNLKYII